MLDLNLNADSASDLQMESSGSFNSSVVNAADTDDSCSYGDAVAYNFAILNNAATSDGLPLGAAGEPSVRTIQLFPAADSGASAAAWLDFSSKVDQHGAPPEQRITPRQQQVKKSRRGPRSRSSQYRGVTFYRRTGRWESHIWDCGKQVYLGGFDTAHVAARAYDRAAIKFRGVDADINFNVSDYDEDIKQMSNFTKEEFVHILRRQSTGFSRGSSKYRGVTLHKCGRWEARMGQFLGKKYIYLGLFDSELEAARFYQLIEYLSLNSLTFWILYIYIYTDTHLMCYFLLAVYIHNSRAYDKAAIKCNGREAVTNFEPSLYEGEVISQSDNEDTKQSLDLNLGIAPPSYSDGQIKNTPSNGSGMIAPQSWDDIPLDKRVMFEHSGSRSRTIQPPHHGFSIASGQHPSVWNGSNFFPIYEETAIEKRMEAAPVPNWAWQVQGPYGRATLAPPFSTAASSGFPSTIIPSAADTQIRFPNMTFLHSHFPSSITNSGTISPFFFGS
ncbi:hypothetical protein AAZX31_19G163900 [Glycine max]|nr:hypothetical protein GLYMA_19G178200v4 [Glycine max]KAH1078382.1 hypothetical protein GYH30_053405 [Glycine max]KAH1195189.1 Floral homeotic protein APETALA 2 [Glycine max]KAH1195190.1 Floral homeotic protein APETALA 2 [Glycine max]